MAAPAISVSELSECMTSEDIVIIDCRFALADPHLGEHHYREAHIPGAFYLHLDRDLSGPKGLFGGRHPLPDVDALAQKLAAIGINSSPPTRVVVYDDSRLGFAARAWWLLCFLGHDQVQVLDGGFTAWCEAGLPVTNTLPVARAATFEPRLRADRVVDIQAVRSLQNSADVALIDAREARRYWGLEEPIDPIAGHIPGAQNFPWQQVCDGRGLLLADAAQRQRWCDVGDTKNIVVYCGSGVTACANILSLAQIGRDDVKLYAGSWSDWCSHLLENKNVKLENKNAKEAEDRYRK